MPRFLDLFLYEIRQSKDKIKKLLTISKDKLQLYESLFPKYWNSLPDIQNFKGEVFAVDSSDGIIEYRDGVIIHVCRALALSNTRKECRELKVNIFYDPRKRNDLVIFRSRMREHLEHLVSLKCLNNYNEDLNSRVLFLDGSLYGRMSHVPKDSEIPGYQSFMLDYIETYSNILKKSKEKNIPIIGVSKDSRSRLLGRILLTHKLKHHLTRSSLNSETETAVLSSWSEIWKRPRNALRKIEKLSKETTIPSEIKEVFKEALISRPDIQIISSLIKEPGYTTPLILGIPTPALDPLLYAFESGTLETYIENNFSKALVEEGEEIVEKAKKILLKIFEYPAIYMFYYIPGKNEIPLRIDVPGWTLGFNYHIDDVKSYETPYSENKLEWILNMLNSFYAGPKHYNVLLEEVDLKVKLKQRDLITIYESALMKELKILIEHTRDVRRVKYP